MPCYCDIPDSDDQQEIERRCKTNMYFAATASLTADQIEGNFIKALPLPDVNICLCIVCKILTAEQMKGISADYYDIKWPHDTLYDWYLQHIEDDKNLALKETDKTRVTDAAIEKMNKIKEGLNNDR